MPAKDKYHHQVRRALEKEGWIITHDPYTLRSIGVNFPIDLGAEKLIAAERANEKIVVEIKSFLGESIPNEFHTALGQYLDYELGMEDQEPDRKTFLAMPVKVYNKILTIPLLVKSLTRHNVNLIIFEPIKEVINQWLIR